MQSYKSVVVRASALAAMLGGVLWSAKAFYDRNDAPPWPTDVADDLFFVVLVFFLAGLSGLYARCRGHLGEWEPANPHGLRRGRRGAVRGHQGPSSANSPWCSKSGLLGGSGCRGGCSSSGSSS
jgi:hypothetical protein